MVVMSIKISDGNVPKSRNENGNCSVNGASVHPVKWKRRHVSCVRDFPPGCGPVPIAAVPTVSSPVVDNHVGSDVPINVVVLREAEPVSSPVTDNHAASDAPIDVVVHREAEPVSSPVADNHVASDAPIDVVVPREAEPVSSPVVDNHVGSDAPINVVVLREAEPVSSPVTDNHAASDAPIDVVHREAEPVSSPVADNHVASDAPIDVVVPREAEPVSSPVVDNHVNSDVGSGEAVGSSVGNLVNDVVQNGDVKADNGVSVVMEARPRMKYKPRKFCAVRDFPPFCGLNAPEPTEEDRRRINGMKTCVTESNRSVNGDLVENTQSDESNEASVTNQEMQMIVESKTDVENVKFESSKKAQNIGQACQELVLYTRDKDMQIVSSVDDARDVDYEEDARDNTPLSIIQKDMNVNNREAGSKKHVKKRPSDGTKDSVFMGDKIKVVMGLKAPSLCTPETQKNNLTKEAKGRTSITPKKIKEKFVGESSSTKAANTGTLEKVEKDLTNKVKGDASMTPKKSIKKKQKKATVASTLAMVVRNDEDSLTDIEEKEGFFNLQGTDDVYEDVDVDVDVSLPPFGPRSSNDVRNKVRETLRFFQVLCRKLLQGEEAKTNDANPKKKRVDLEAKAQMDKRGRTLVLGEKTYGPVPGVEVGDEFQYRVELALVGIHRPFQGGIDYVKKGNEFFAVSVVASGGYDNEVDKPDCLMYSGAGGVGKDKSYENQKLERGNLALKNNVDLKYPVRVIRGYKVKPPESSDSKNKVLTAYIYDGLYTVESCNQVIGPKGNMVFKFELKRVPGQPQLAKREVMSKKYKKREGVCVKDISDGKEKFPICAINTIDDEKPPAFTYITKIMYPDWYKPIPPEGCDCVGRCSEKKCPCAFKNGGEIPYNRNGAIVEAKPLVYECGPLCKCPPSCYNRVTQHGMKIHLEIFKTESRGWGVRSLSSISSGSFICEYVGELLEESEAEERKGNDEYLFDIGQNYNDCSLNPDTKPVEIANSGDGFTIDAAYYGNVGRFINHSCSPNLYAQNVLYDEDDKRMPHIMLFAAENIPPLQELTYHYNYAVDEVYDADGNIKVKSCYCGSSECTGRMY